MSELLPLFDGLWFCMCVCICVCVCPSVFIRTNTGAEGWKGLPMLTANINSVVEMEDSEKQRTTALVLWLKEGFLFLCLPCTPFMLWSPSTVTYRTGKVFSTDLWVCDPSKACRLQGDSRTSVTFTPRQVKGWVLWVPLFQKRKGNCVVGCWGHCVELAMRGGWLKYRW